MHHRDSSPNIQPRVLSVSGDCSCIADAVLREIGDTPLALLLLFCPDGNVVGTLSAELSSRLGPSSNVLACSSAGGFAFNGYDDENVIAIAFPAGGFTAQAIWLSNLRQHVALDWMLALRQLNEQFLPIPGRQRFGLLLVDGMSRCEELVTATIEAALPDLLVLGGSAGDGLRFKQTRLAMNGEERAESALFCLISTSFAVEEVIFDHFVPVGETMVVTEADPDNRVIYEINAEPAAAEYARLIGMSEDKLGPKAFAENPLLAHTGGRHFVRAISGVTASRGLSLMSSVEIGAVLTLGRPESLTEGLRLRIDQIGPAEMILGFDCVLRRIAIEQAGEEATVDELCRDYRIAGFNTYGEQHGGIHMNQTFVGLALMTPETAEEVRDVT